MSRTLNERFGPLRLIVGREPATYTDRDGVTHTLAGVYDDVLICGHRQRERRDIAGPTVATRRRCRTCRRTAAD